jgi:broad specificity phosphatase PhoE
VTVDLRSIHGTADFYFIRHGESEANREGIMQGRIHSRLTEAGREQAREAGGWFREKSLDLILTSPLARAAETAAIISDRTGLPAEAVEDLTEIDTGIFTGLSFAQARERYPEAWNTFQRESWEGVPKAEKISELLVRAEAIWARLVAAVGQGRRTVLCVTHSGILQWIIRSTFGSRSWMPLFSASGNCCVSHLRVANAERADGFSGHLATWVTINTPIRMPPITVAR